MMDYLIRVMQDLGYIRGVLEEEIVARLNGEVA